MDSDFDNFLNSKNSEKTKASEMEHAIRHHISENFENDPEFFRPLSERLEEIIDKHKDNWSKLSQDLKSFLEKVKSWRWDKAVDWLNVEQMPYFDIIKSTIFKKEKITDKQTNKLIDLTIEIFEILDRELEKVDFWSDDIIQKRLKKLITEIIRKSQLLKITDIKLKDELIEKIFNLARHLSK